MTPYYRRERVQPVELIGDPIAQFDALVAAEMKEGLSENAASDYVARNHRRLFNAYTDAMDDLLQGKKPEPPKAKPKPMDTHKPVMPQAPPPQRQQRRRPDFKSCTHEELQALLGDNLDGMRLVRNMT